MSNSVRPHRRQPTRLRCPWDSPSKNTGVGYHFLLQCMKVKSESEVSQSCLTLSDPMNCSPPGSSVHGIFQARVLEWGANVFPRVSLNHFLFRKEHLPSCDIRTHQPAAGADDYECLNPITREEQPLSWPNHLSPR